MLIMVGVMVVFFFFKQKTAYEMRISDWSSDVCSSDLLPGTWPGRQQRTEVEQGIPDGRHLPVHDGCHVRGALVDQQVREVEVTVQDSRGPLGRPIRLEPRSDLKDSREVRTVVLREALVGGELAAPPVHLTLKESGRAADPVEPRSEEHTSELQSLMR